MTTRRVTSAQLRRLPIGSLAAHEHLQAAVLTYLTLSGWPATPIHTGPRVAPGAAGGYELRGNRAQVGMADVLSCDPNSGRLVLLELKSGQAKRSRAQRELHERFEAAGAWCLVVRDVRELEPVVGSARTQFGAGGSEPRKRRSVTGDRPCGPPHSTTGGHP